MVQHRIIHPQPGTKHTNTLQEGFTYVGPFLFSQKIENTDRIIIPYIKINALFYYLKKSKGLFYKLQWIKMKHGFQ